MTVVVGSDHAGFELKELVAEHLRGRGLELTDLGTHSTASVDYPHYARAVGEAVAGKAGVTGVLVCGTGMGMAIAANKIAGVRAALCANELVARLSRAHNDANVLCLGGRVVGPALAFAIVDAFFDTAFEGGRHEKRVRMIGELEAATR